MNANILMHLNPGETPKLNHVCDHGENYTDKAIHLSVGVRFDGGDLSIFGSPSQLRAFAHAITQGIDKAMKERYEKE